MNEQGEAIAFVTAEQESELFDIERIMRQEIPEEEVDGFVPTPESETNTTPKRKKDQKKKPRHRKQKRKTASKAKETNEEHPEDEQADK